jgi:hypothetical protein
VLRYLNTLLALSTFVYLVISMFYLSTSTHANELLYANIRVLNLKKPFFIVVAPAPNYKIPGNIQVSVALMYRRRNKSSEPELDFKCNFGSASNQYYYGVSW